MEQRMAVITMLCGAGPEKSASVGYRGPATEDILAAGLGWPRISGYNKRAGMESQMARSKSVLGEALCFHTDAAQATEIAIGVEVLNRKLELGLCCKLFV